MREDGDNSAQVRYTIQLMHKCFIRIDLDGCGKLSIKSRRLADVVHLVVCQAGDW